MVAGSRAAARRSRLAAAGHVAAGERAAAGGREAPRALLADLRVPRVVERPELGEVRPGLLEVVAEDLLELGAAVAVDAGRPRPTNRSCRSARARFRSPS